MTRSRFVAVCCALLVLASGVLVRGQADKPTEPAKQPESPAQAKLAAARHIFSLEERRERAGLARDNADAEFHHTWSVRLMEAERDAAGADDAAARRQAVQQHLDRMSAR